ncbi:phosphate transport system regulatory protein PhoU [Arenicella chitinivorans]|uniref:Phosphate-specific transport system accessory protein PhoU n=1 Tax=Arenicella chitinivorans TaxID=1329800 RepID=A0A918VQP4_9GAMM|nr:phosphate signaling complex protein PhoU [Arenicella chitinivorans]GHA15983.1 phosphate transport system regulatory protein PhoU [Arenicella chitinivorans]
MNEEIKVGGHISRQFDEELEEIRARVLKMGGLVEAQLDKALHALREDSSEQIVDVEKLDRKVNKLEMLIDEECTQILAKRQPAAGDLRLIIATSKSVRDLERIGDEAERVATMVRHALDNDASNKSFKGLLSLGEHVKELLHATLNTYARMDSRSAVLNMRMDQHIDEEYSRVVVRLVNLMKKDSDNISDALDVMWAARSLERIGDHCINICENVIYLVEGEDVRHTAFDRIKERLG